MRFTDILLVLTLSVTANALVISSKSITQSHHLSKRSPGKGIQLLGKNNSSDELSQEEEEEYKALMEDYRQHKREKKKKCRKHQAYLSEMNNMGFKSSALKLVSQLLMGTSHAKPHNQSERKAQMVTEDQLLTECEEASRNKKEAKKKLKDFKRLHGITTILT
ncbi:hypothetical protein BATDEDRAFT_24241 [Batrachochytrium dendrobatidis JAM81]|uniref:Uncharacterized protein n=2 Tax=Batrachochytrium dendrobatidis TaxID=109871 RepID=F4P0V7_BATDJ|nr:uncharacterized protein BATDEDRAFT_24241 [Batrachochytrium dendrobatidis JAM81]EGF81350.1 hypothetical protein BATDEDRAFT_24241 [Batrachochytrium dendrobatidis JAM81]KAJ8329570.1 hypothetical protein O5D80_002142 [Batrachochytrium dendrobatidis]|eukprot:XP_006677947.1 hypothetical protein BATDEDRAFT_24241 [Batrachochytrium dendrobatidis JAM81]